MKTIGDLERWLKGAVCAEGLDICFGPTRKVFYVKIKGVSVESATLEGALENALEELRRKDNGAESMRTEKIVEQVTAVGKAVLNSKSVKVLCPQCPYCGYGASGINKAREWICYRDLSHLWTEFAPLAIGNVYSLSTGTGFADYKIGGFTPAGYPVWVSP